MYHYYKKKELKKKVDADGGYETLSDTEIPLLEDLLGDEDDDYINVELFNKKQFLQCIHSSVHASTSITKVSESLHEFFENFEDFLSHRKEVFQCRIWSTSTIRRKLRFNLSVLNLLFVALDIITKNKSEDGITLTWDDTTRADDIYQHLNIEFLDEETDKVIIDTIGYLTTYNKAADGIEYAVIDAVDRLQQYIDILKEPQNLEILKQAFGDDISITKTVAERVENGKADRASVTSYST